MPCRLIDLPPTTARIRRRPRPIIAKIRGNAMSQMRCVVPLSDSYEELRSIWRMMAWGRHHHDHRPSVLGGRHARADVVHGDRGGSHHDRGQTSCWPKAVVLTGRSARRRCNWPWPIITGRR